jgi:hypothetical protein
MKDVPAFVPRLGGKQRGRPPIRASGMDKAIRTAARGIMRHS